MYTKDTYIGTLNGYGAIWCGFDPRPQNPDAVVDEVRTILYPEENYILERISDQEKLPSVWLKDGDVQENYHEVEAGPSGL